MRFGRQASILAVGLVLGCSTALSTSSGDGCTADGRSPEAGAMDGGLTDQGSPDTSTPEGSPSDGSGSSIDDAGFPSDGGSCMATGTFVLQSYSTTGGSGCLPLPLPPNYTVTLDGGPAPASLLGDDAGCASAGCTVTCVATDSTGSYTTTRALALASDGLSGTYQVTYGVTGQTPSSSCFYDLTFAEAE